MEAKALVRTVHSFPTHELRVTCAVAAVGAETVQDANHANKYQAFGKIQEAVRPAPARPALPLHVHPAHSCCRRAWKPLCCSCEPRGSLGDVPALQLAGTTGQTSGLQGRTGHARRPAAALVTGQRPGCLWGASVQAPDRSLHAGAVRGLAQACTRGPPAPSPQPRVRMLAAQMSKTLTTERMALKTELESGLNNVADEGAYADELQVPELAIFSSGKLTEWAAINALDLLAGAPRDHQPLLHWG